MSVPVRMGEQVYFVHHGTTLEGKVVGVENVTDPRHGKPGLTFYVKHDDELRRVHCEQVVGTVPQLPDNSPIWS